MSAYQFLSAIFILLNPLAGLFVVDRAPLPQAVFFDTADSEKYRLPLAEKTFIASQFLPIYPVRNWNIKEPEITAETVVVFDASRQIIFWQKNDPNKARPIASLTKLTTALIAVEHAGINEIFTVSQNAIASYGEMGGLKVGEKLTAEKLLYALLLESSNDAATAIAENINNKISPDSQEDFIGLMNKKARELNLTRTFYADPSGLDPRNQSSANDLIKIMEVVFQNSILREIIKTPAIDVASDDGLFQHHFINTNKLFSQFPELLGGKTGYTEEAGNCMITGFIAPDKQSPIFIIIMNSRDRIEESAALIQWTKTAFLW